MAGQLREWGAKFLIIDTQNAIPVGTEYELPFGGYGLLIFKNKYSGYCSLYRVRADRAELMQGDELCSVRVEGANYNSLKIFITPVRYDFSGYIKLI